MVVRLSSIQRRIQKNCCITRVTALYSGGSLSHGPVSLYSYTARAYTAALYRIQPIHYTALYADPLKCVFHTYLTKDCWGPLGTAGDGWGRLGTAGDAGDRWGSSFVTAFTYGKFINWP